MNCKPRILTTQLQKLKQKLTFNQAGSCRLKSVEGKNKYTNSKLKMLSCNTNGFEHKYLYQKFFNYAETYFPGYEGSI